MKRLLIQPVTILAFIAIISTFLTKCGNNTVHTPGPSKSGKSLNAAAWKLRNDGASSDEFIGMQKKALEQLRRGESPDDAVTVLEQLGFFYYIIGDYENAIIYYQEAADSLRMNPARPRGEGVIQLFGDMGSLYRTFGMFDKALEYNDSALAESRRLGGVLMSDLYVFRSNIFQELNDTANAIKCYDLAIEAINKGNTNARKDYLRAFVNGERGNFMLMNYPHDRDSVTKAIGYISEYLKYEDTDTSPIEFSYGYGLSLLGETHKGIDIMERTMATFREQGDMEMLVFAQKTLMGEYARLGMGKKMEKLYPEFIASDDSLNNLRKMDYAIGAMVEYNTKIKSQKNELLEKELRIHRQGQFLVIAIAALVTVVAIFMVVVFMHRYRRERLSGNMKQQKISRLEVTQHEQRQHLENLEADLNLKMYGNNEILSNPQLLDGEKRGKFRRAFDSLYPNVVNKLKERYPRLTQNDELLCILIYLKHTPEEIGIFLGISKASVNTARYRLRQKLQLPADISLDKFIQSFNHPTPQL